jgi:hypothetical protein
LSNALAERLNLGVAWRRVKYDLKHRSFLALPYEVELIETDLDGWLGSIDTSLRSDTYNPGPMVVCDVPKPGFLIRPGSHLSLADRVVYTAAVGACFAQIHGSLQWAQGAVDFAYPISRRSERRVMASQPIPGWQHFRERSKAILAEQGITHALFGDIAAFYENIDISMLTSDLRSLNSDPDVIKLLSMCLNRWAQVTGRGIPQGISASDIIAKLYLNSVDLNLRAEGFRHLRYVDDVRVFADSGRCWN